MQLVHGLPSRSGYTFKGFYNATSGGTQVYNASGVLLMMEPIGKAEFGFILEM